MMKSMNKNTRKGFALLPLVILGAAVIIAAGVFFGISKQPHVTVINTTAPPTQSFGASGSPAVQSQASFLSGSGVTSVATTISVTSFVLSDGSTPITISMFGSGATGYATLEPGTTREENISFTGVVQNSNGSALLTGVTRGLTFSFPCTSTSSLQKAHAGGTKLVLSNSNCFYQNFVTAANDASITGLYTFASNTPPTYGATPSLTNSLQLANKGYVDGVASSGAADAGIGSKGLVAITTPGGAATSTDGAAVLYNMISKQYYATSSQGATTTVIMANNGQLDNSWVSSTSYTYGTSTTQTFNGSITGNATASIPYLVPPGVVEAYTSSTAPNGWLLCNGQTVATSTYPALFKILGYTWGGSTSTFGVPNLGGLFIAGPSSTLSTTIGATGGATSTNGSINISTPNGSGPGGGGLPLAYGFTASTSVIGNPALPIIPPYMILQYIIKF